MVSGDVNPELSSISQLRISPVNPNRERAASPPEQICEVDVITFPATTEETVTNVEEVARLLQVGLVVFTIVL